MRKPYVRLRLLSSDSINTRQEELKRFFQGDVVKIPKGTTVLFNSPSTAKAFYVGQRYASLPRAGVSTSSDAVAVLSATSDPAHGPSTQSASSRWRRATKKPKVRGRVQV